MTFVLANQRFNKIIYQIAGEKYNRFIHVYLGWKKIVGPLLAERSQPIKLENDVLFVGVQNSSWMQELVLLKTDIIAKYANYGEQLQDIIYLIQSPGKRKK
ncbi:MAG: DUF721 domain-containing protein [Candidatus Cloacimonetes bacterium]|jgi:hypothetical protein|nr:DUF721 domain-containing protein [Candidatus Cloacimonadota bacterium]